MYPKEELAKIMDDEEFLHHNIKDCLKESPTKASYLDQTSPCLQKKLSDCKSKALEY